MGIAVLGIVASGLWRPGIGFEVLGTRIELQNLIRELIMVFVGLASLRVTNPTLRTANGFEWEPIREVSYLFAGIFICIIPVMAMLEAGARDPFRPRSMSWRGAERQTTRSISGRPASSRRSSTMATYLVFSARRRRPVALMVRSPRH